jgi:BioD-like phosphotransacetylase family protein
LVALYVTTREKGSGKTAICAGIGKHLLDEGKKPGYLKPVITEDKNAPARTDTDAEFIKTLFSLDESLDLLCPGVSSSNLASDIKNAVNKVSEGKDAVIIDGPSEQYRASADIAKGLNARLLIVEHYTDDISQAIVGYKGFGQSLLGVVFNKVPKAKMDEVLGEVSGQLKKVGVDFLGAIPEDRMLFTLTVGELAERINGEMLRGTEKSDDIIENVMLGAMTVDHGTDYFGRKENKAAVIRSERPDMQLAAMQTSTRCLVLTGETAPKPVVLISAEEKNIPVITTRDDTATVMLNIENALVESRINRESKFARLEKIMAQNVDFQSIDKGLGLAG